MLPNRRVRVEVKVASIGAHQEDCQEQREENGLDLLYCPGRGTEQPQVLEQAFLVGRILVRRLSSVRRWWHWKPCGLGVMGDYGCTTGRADLYQQQKLVD
jgi:hypothetical protein